MLSSPHAYLGILSLLTMSCLPPPADLEKRDGAASPDARLDARPDARLDALPSPDGGLCEGLPTGGRCQGNELLGCDPLLGPSLRDCSAEGAACLSGDGAPPRCGPLPATCSELQTGSLCAGDRLYLCHGGWLRHIPCDALGGRCSSDGSSPGCTPREGGDLSVTGLVTRDHREAGPEGLGPLVSAPAEGVTVTLLAAEDQRPLALATTDAEGRFTLTYDPGPLASELVLRVITLCADERHRLWVTDAADAAYAFESAPFPAGTDPPHIHVAESDASGAFHIYETLRGLQGDGEKYLAFALPPVRAIWEPGVLPASGTSFSRYPPTILVSGAPADPDEFDSSVLGHEFGHYLLWVASRDDSPGGPHDGSPTDPRLAWSEGAATWVGLGLLGQELYVDTMATGALVKDPEELGAMADPQGGLGQPLSEDLVLQLLWDMTDPASGTDPAPGPEDPMSAPPCDLFDVLTGYLPSEGLLHRGVVGVDLVDFLDGWICRGHGDIPGLTTLLAGAGFPYDFDGPASPCPKPSAQVELDLRVEEDSGALRVALTLWSPQDIPESLVHLVLPLTAREPHRARREMAPIEARSPTLVSWILPPGWDPPWVAAGIEFPSGRLGMQHASAFAARRMPPPPGHRIMSLGGLLRLRLSGS